MYHTKLLLNYERKMYANSMHSVDNLLKHHPTYWRKNSYRQMLQKELLNVQSNMNIGV